MIYDINQLGKEIITLGRRGENLAETLKIDVSPWLAMWPDASVNIVVLRPRDDEAYIASTTVTDGILSWPITNTDTANEGLGTFEVRAIYDEVVKKSVTVTSKVCPCISCTGDPEPPEGCKDWVNDVLQAASRAEKAAERAEDIAEALAGGDSDVGADLFLPKVTEEDNGKVMTVVEGNWAAKALPVYNGAYAVTPSTREEQTLQTAQMYMDADVTVLKVPYFEVANTSNGITATIGEVEE